MTPEQPVRFAAAYLQQTRTQASNIATASAASCPGLSSKEFKFLSLHASDTAWDKSQGGLKLEDTKVTATKLLSSGLFKDDERFIPAIYASANSNSRISDIGEDILKRVSVDLDQSSLVKKLYDIYLSSESAKGNVPLLPGVRIRLLSWLAKSTASASFPKQVISIVKEELGIAESGQTMVLSQPGREASKLHAALLTFIQSLVQTSKSSNLSLIAKELIEPLRFYIENQGWPVADSDQDTTSRGHCYEIIGLLAKATKTPDIALLKWLFTSLEEDTSGNIMLSIDEAISHTIEIFRDLGVKQRDEFEKLLSISLDTEKLS